MTGRDAARGPRHLLLARLVRVAGLEQAARQLLALGFKRLQRGLLLRQAGARSLQACLGRGCGVAQAGVLLAHVLRERGCGREFLGNADARPTFLLPWLTGCSSKSALTAAIE